MMPAKILEKRNLNGQHVWCLNGTDFSSKGVKFTITGSETTGPGIYEVIHTIKNTITGAYAPISMLKLIEILLSCDD